MGFGSYDESEQENQQQGAEADGEAVSVHENGHDGGVSFESDTGTDLLPKLDDIRSSEASD